MAKIKVPIIASFDRFMEFNESLRVKDRVKPISIESVNYETHKIIVGNRERTYIYYIDKFLLDFVKGQDLYISSNIKALEPYDFTEFFAQTHPEEFKKQIDEYVNNLNLIGEKSFSVGSFTINVESGGLEIVGYTGSALRGHIFIPYGITAIKNGAFSKFKALNSVVLPPTLKEIGGHAFADSGIREIELPDSVEIIGRKAFGNCRGLNKAKLSKNLKLIDMDAFVNTSIDELIMYDKVEKIGMRAFRDCYYLKRVKLSKNLKQIDMQAFMLSGIESIEIPDTVTVIEDCTFYKCKNLKEVRLSKNLEVIEDNAFADTAVEEINLPDSVTTVSYGAFTNCKKLRKLNIPSKIEYMTAGEIMETPLISALEKIFSKTIDEIFDEGRSAFLYKIRGLTLEG